MNLWKSQTPAEPCLGNNVVSWGFGDMPHMPLKIYSILTSWHSHTDPGTRGYARIWESPIELIPEVLAIFWKTSKWPNSLALKIAATFLYILYGKHFESFWSSNLNGLLIYGGYVRHGLPNTMTQGQLWFTIQQSPTINIPSATCSGHGCSLFTFNFHWSQLSVLTGQDKHAKQYTKKSACWWSSSTFLSKPAWDIACSRAKSQIDALASILSQISTVWHWSSLI